MNWRSAVGISGAILFPIFLGFLWWCGTQAGYINPWSIFWFVPLVVVLGIPAGFVLTWFGMAFLQGLVEEQVTRVQTLEEKEDERYE
jgi:hypothetical protein